VITPNSTANSVFVTRCGDGTWCCSTLPQTYNYTCCQDHQGIALTATPTLVSSISSILTSTSTSTSASSTTLLSDSTLSATVLSSTASSSSNSDGSTGTLDQAAKVGIGVGVGLGAALIITALSVVLYLRKRSLRRVDAAQMNPNLGGQAHKGIARQQIVELPAK
jgi:hypothetical protein